VLLRLCPRCNGAGNLGGSLIICDRCGGDCVVQGGSVDDHALVEHRPAPA
jgi:DnaJ-class molecular chaperone